ncbi:hypothetical protein AgCh_030399 [Apium graveolens]
MINRRDEMLNNDDTQVKMERYSIMAVGPRSEKLGTLLALQLDWSLLSVLVERWRPETHTFHLPMGEVTVTLHDVGVLLGLPIDGRALIADDIPGPGDALLELVASIFGCAPESSRLNGARISLSFFTSLTPHYLSEDASLDEVRNRTRCYLVQIIASVLFTDTSGGSYARDARKAKRRSMAVFCCFSYGHERGCLLLLRFLQLCVYIILLFGMVSLRHHTETGGFSIFLLEMVGRTVSVYRIILDGLASSHFKWEPYSDIIDDLPAYCLTGRHIWRYRGPLLYLIDGGDSTVPDYHDWYLQRTVKFISRTGAFHSYIGDLLRSIADQTVSVLPDVHRLAADGCNAIRDFRLYGFDGLTLDERRVREMNVSKIPAVVVDVVVLVVVEVEHLQIISSVNQKIQSNNIV